MKKIVFVFLTIFLMASWVFASGSSQQSSGGTSSSVTPLTDDRSKTLDIIWWGYNLTGVLPYDGSIVQREMERRYNIRITNVPVDSYNGEQKNLLWATGIDFDVLVGWAAIGTLSQRVDSGLIRPISIDMMNRFAPGIVGMLANASPQWANIAMVDGVLYGFPHYSVDQESAWGLSVRTDWLKNLGVTTLPKTLDELEALMVRFRNDDPDGNGRRDTYGLSMAEGVNGMSINPYLFGAYGVQLNQWGIDTDGSPKWYAIDDNYRQALIKLNEWWAKEIYDPSILVNQTRNDNMARVGNGFVAGYFGTDWLLLPRAASLLSGWNLLIQEHPEYDVDNLTTYIAPVSGPMGARTLQFNTPLMNQVTNFGRRTTDEKVARLLSMFNDILTQRELFLLVQDGILGQQWDYNADGRPEVKPEWLNPEKASEYGQARFYPHLFFPKEFSDIALTPGQVRSREFMKDYPVFPIHTASLFNTEADTEYVATRTIATEYFWKAVTGEWNVNSTWDDYVRRWTAAGGQQTIDAKKKIAVELGLNSR